MGQGRWLRQRGVERRRRRADGCTQRTVQCVAGCGCVVITLRHQLHAARAGTDEVHALRMNDGRRNGHAHRQGKPHQHEAGDVEGVTQALHVSNYVLRP